MTQSLLVLQLVVAFLALIPEALYAIRYHVKSKGAWKDHFLSRTIMLKAVVLCALLSFMIFNTLWLLIVGDSYALRVPIWMVLFSLFAAALWRQWWSFEKIQHEKDIQP